MAWRQALSCFCVVIVLILSSFGVQAADPIEDIGVRRVEFEIAWDPHKVKAQHHAFRLGDTPQIHLRFAVTHGELRDQASLQYEVYDFWGNLVDTGETPLITAATDASGAYVTIAPEVTDPGWYRINLHVSDAHGPLEVGYITTTGATNENEPIVTFAVVPDGVRPAESPFGVDTAMSWLVAEEQTSDFAEMLELTGVTWMRDRIQWRAVQPDGPGDITDWGHPAQVAAYMAELDIRILQVFHDAPAWTRPHGSRRLPDDLFAVHEFARQAAGGIGETVLAWEIWNEQDATFSTEPADHYAAVLKAAALGFRRSDAPPLIASGPVTSQPGAYVDLMLANGIAPYVDIYSFHTDADVRSSAYEDVLDRHFQFIADRGMGDKQFWISESGRPFSRVPVTDFHTDAVVQTEYLLRAYVLALAKGIDKIFWFVMPHYMERGMQFGMLRADLTPMPAYSALATITATLGEGTYIGQWHIESVTAHLFDAGPHRVAVLWSAEPYTVHIAEAEAPQLTMVDAMGRQTRVQPVDGIYGVQVGPLPIFLQGISPTTFPLTTPRKGSRNEAPATDINLDIVLLARFAPDMLPAERVAAPLGYMVRAGETITFTVDVYNFGDEAVDGVLHLLLPDGFTSAKTQATVSVSPYSKTPVAFEMTAAQRLPLADHRVRVEGVFGGREITPTVIRLLERW